MSVGIFGVDAVRASVLTIDLHRGHLDLNVATLPLQAAPAARVTAANVDFLRRARERGLPVVHMVTTYRDLSEIHSNPFWRAIDATSATRAEMREHNLLGSPGTELMPGILEPGDRIVSTKKRYDCFLGTDLDFVLKSMGVKHPPHHRRQHQQLRARHDDHRLDARLRMRSGVGLCRHHGRREVPRHGSGVRRTGLRLGDVFCGGSRCGATSRRVCGWALVRPSTGTALTSCTLQDVG